MSHFPPLYLTISRTVNAPRRLAALRARAATKNKTDWRAVRDWTFCNGAGAYGELSQGFNDSDCGPLAPKRPVWYTHTGPKFRNERFADECDGGPDHTGWFTSDDQHAKMRGIVGRLSHGRFIAGYHSSDNDERVYFGDVYDDEREAARAADSEAERIAEDEREYNERWRAARDLADECDTLQNDVRELFPMRHHARARRELAAAVESLRSKRAELKNDYSDIEV